MSRFGVFGKVSLLVVIGAALVQVGFAQPRSAVQQQQQKEKAKPAKQQSKGRGQAARRAEPSRPQVRRPQQQRAQPQARRAPASRTQPARPANQQRAPRQGQSQNMRQRARPAEHVQLRLSEQQRRRQQSEQRSAWRDHRASGSFTYRNWHQRGGYRGYRVPDSYYRDNYGENHMFVVYRQPFMQIGGYPSFQYGGYWFSMMDPVPQYWGGNWYQDDRVYVVYADNGYYLYNQRYPNRPGIAITISF